MYDFWKTRATSPSISVTLAALALLGFLTACAEQGGEPADEPPTDAPAANGFVSFNDFMAAVPAASSGDYLGGEGRRVESAEAFEEMRVHLEDLYRGVDVAHSFTMDGDLHVDCVPVEQQPALRRPGMEGQEIQSPPSVPPVPAAGGDDAPKGESTGSNLVAGNDRFGHDRGCPEGSFPMRRVTLDEMTRFATLRDFFSKFPGGGGSPFSESAASTSTHYYAHAYQHVNNIGGSSYLNLWSPTAASSHMSLSQQWYSAGSGSNLQTVEGGWQVYPNKYSTSLAVPFTYWTSADYSNGCYNLDCGAFVQTSTSWVLGVPWPSSSYSVPGGYQYSYQQQWYYDSGSGRWWLRLNGATVGYYPGGLYGDGPLASGAATRIDFGGEDTGAPSALQMGSGRLASAGGSYAAFQNDISYYVAGIGVESATLTARQKWPSCYTIDLFNSGVTYFYFGGPSCN